MQNKVFISAPISLAWSTVTEFALTVRRAGGEPVWWDRNTRYIQSDFDKADSVLFLLPGNKFESSQYGLPIGLKSELSRAFALNKNIYLGYITSNGNHSIYRADTDGYSIAGLSGTTGCLKQSLESINAAEKIAANSRYGAFVDNPCAEIELPKAQRVYAKTIPSWHFEECDGIDKRLLLMI